MNGSAWQWYFIMNGLARGGEDSSPLIDFIHNGSVLAVVLHNEWASEGGWGVGGGGGDSSPFNDWTVLFHSFIMNGPVWQW